MTKINCLKKYQKYILFVCLAISPYFIYEINKKFVEIQTYNDIEKENQRILFEIQKTTANILSKKIIEYSYNYAKIVGILTYTDIDNKNHTSEEIDIYNPGYNSYGKTYNVIKYNIANKIDIWYKRRNASDFYFNEYNLFDISKFYNNGNIPFNLIVGIVIFIIYISIILCIIYVKTFKLYC
jgi:hypothetical protein